MFILAIISVLLGFLSPILIISLIVMALNKKNKDNKTNFNNTLKNIYVYLILIITLLILIIGTISVFRYGLDLIFPEEIENQSYTNEQLERNETIIETITIFSILLVSFPIFIYHNKLAKDLRKNNKEKQNIIEETNKKGE